jgi:hypothetical protein
MKMVATIPVTMLAPCGMNCALCYAHLRKSKPCLGCRGPDESKPKHCRQCRIYNCAQGYDVRYCVDCPVFPCVVVKRLDKSYRQRYQVSLMDNARRLKAVGVEQYLHEERETWLCPCGGAISLHDRICSECGQAMESCESF